MPTIGEIMTRDVYTASRGDSIADVAGVMLKGRFGSVVVTEGSILLGIFTERDVLRAAAAHADLTASKISEWMTNDPMTASADQDSDEAAQIMMANGFRHLPVVDGSKLIGIVSLRDVLRTRIRRTPSPGS
jgi:CBS domain-containing protein